MVVDTSAERLQWARKKHGKYRSPTDAARAFGWTVSTYLGHENGDRNPSRAAAKRYAKAYGVRWEWLLEGEGQPELRPAQIVVPAGQEFPPDPEFVDDALGADAAGRADRRELRPGEVVERDVTGGLGAGGVGSQIVVEGKVLDNVRATWTLPVEYLRAELRAREADVDIIAVDGDSMIPTLVPGDRVMINRRQTAPSPDGLYAIHDGIGVVVKRLEVMQGVAPPRVRIKSDNPAHGYYEQPAEEVRVIGRVICKVTRM